ncbi:hypothetical protein D0C16_18480 [Cellvibrio sp. KY-GH-1]|uniref:glycoside hydrolase family protein n=1 Tax=Cellvibrio sp. KY-GH-1 TaxID=2303332 RepID=UPI001244FC6A|nr:glycoside hydrolase family protein [Cellvibrio sp. KY-GH-1]QEY17804.1 hypothetical protein D0C16_18480 [Cellvibrio sp. KY-GH-1]
MDLFEIKRINELDWEDIPFVEHPSFGFTRTFDAFNNPNNPWQRVINLREFIAAEFGNYDPIQHYAHTEDRLRDMMHDGHYLSICRTGKPFVAAFEWKENPAHPHNGEWIDAHRFFCGGRFIKLHLDNITHQWHTRKARTFMDELMETPFALAKEKVQEYIPAPPRVPNRIPERATLPVAPAPKIEPEVLPVVNTQTNAKLTRILTLSEGLTIGSQGEEVRLLQQELGFTGDDIDGKFGGKTNSLLKSKIAGLREQEEIKKLILEPKIIAFLRLLRSVESGDRYNVINGGKIFDGYEDHPRISVQYETDGVKWKSSAAGAYQFQPSTWDYYANKLGLSDFSPSNQDLAAIGLLKSQGTIESIQSGNIEGAIYKASKDWDAFPAGPDGQSKWGGSRPLAPLLKKYEDIANDKNLQK